MILQPTCRSKSLENVNCAANERENEEIAEKQKVKKTDSAGCQQSRFDNVVGFSGSTIVGGQKTYHNKIVSKVGNFLKLPLNVTNGKTNKTELYFEV